MPDLGRTRTEGLPLLGLLGLGLLFRLTLAAWLPPGYDEAYYLFYGRHPALSYFDHPLAVGVWSWLGQRCGDSPLSLRLASVVSFTLALWLLHGATRRWYGRRAGLWVVALASLCPLVFICGGVLLLPDSPLLLSLALLLWWLARHPTGVPGNGRQALALAAILAALTLSKYHALPIMATLVAWTFGSAQGRRGWRTPWPWWAALLWALLTSPLWIWNQQHGWASFAFHSARPGGGLHYDPGGSLLFLLAQVGLLFPSIGLLLLAMLGMHPPGGDRSRRATRLLRWLAWPQVIGFVLLAGRMQVMASWLVPAWWLLLPLAAGWLSRRRWGPGPLRFAGLATAVVVPPLLLLAAGQTRWGWLGAWLSTDRDPSAQLMHPDDLRRSLHSRPELWEALRHADVIASYRYDLPGFLALALRHQTRARFTAFSDDARGFPFWEPPGGLSGAQGVLFGVLEPGQPLHRRRFPAVPGPIEPLGMVQVRRSGQPSVVLEFARFGRLGGSDPRAVRRG